MIKSLTKHADILFLGAFISASFWCLVWLIGFAILTGLSYSFDYPTGTTALVMTATILLGHLPKFFAMIVGTDTDFQDLRARFGRHSVSRFPWIRIAISGSLIFILVKWMFPPYLTALQTNIDPMEIGRFVELTFTNLPICLVLFAIQMVFSYPDGEIQDVSSNGRPLPGVS